MNFEILSFKTAQNPDQNLIKIQPNPVNIRLNPTKSGQNPPKSDQNPAKSGPESTEKKVPEKRAPGPQNGGPGGPKIDKKPPKMRSGIEVRKRHQKSAESDPLRPPKSMVSLHRGYKITKSRDLQKGTQMAPKNRPKSTQNPPKSVPGAVPKNHRKKVAGKSGKRPPRTPKTEPEIHQKSSKNGLWAARGVRRRPLAGKGGPGGGYPPKKTPNHQKNHNPDQKKHRTENRNADLGDQTRTHRPQNRLRPHPKPTQNDTYLDTCHFTSPRSPRDP